MVPEQILFVFRLSLSGAQNVYPTFKNRDTRECLHEAAQLWLATDPATSMCQGYLASVVKCVINVCHFGGWVAHTLTNVFVADLVEFCP
jgi:hypothetical protein